MNISDISKYKKFVQSGKSDNTLLNSLSERYSEQYNESISHFDILINSDRANTIIKDGNSYKCVVDYGSLSKKNAFGGIQLRYLREVMTRHSDGIRPGDIVEFVNKTSGAVEKSIFLKTIETRDGYDLSIMQPTNSTLKWVDKDGFIREEFCIFEYNTRSNFGVDSDRVMTLPDGRRQIIVRSNVHTRKLNRENRFIFNDQVFRVIDYDYTSDEGIVNLSLNEDVINDATDNLDLGIANYYGRVANYSIRILNGESFSIRAGQTLQLKAEVKNNGVIVEKSVKWSTSDENIATVDESGILSAHANGLVVITATLVDDTSIADTTGVTVQLSTVNNYSIELDTDLDILVNTTKTFTVVIKNNMIVDNTRTVQWQLTNDDDSTPPIAASRVSNSTTQYTLKGNRVGYVKLKVNLIGSFPVLSETFRIKVESLI